PRGTTLSIRLGLATLRRSVRDASAKRREPVVKYPHPTGVSDVMAPEVLGRLIDAHAAALTLYARQWCAAPEDVVQEAFVKLAGLPSPPPHVVPWLYTVVRRAAWTAARADRRRQKHETRAAARAPAWFVPAEPPGPD